MKFAIIDKSRITTGRAIYAAALILFFAYVLSGSIIDNTDNAYGCYKLKNQVIKISSTRVIIMNLDTKKIDGQSDIVRIEQARGYLIYVRKKLSYNLSENKVYFDNNFQDIAFYINFQFGRSPHIYIDQGGIDIRIFKVPCSEL